MDIDQKVGVILIGFITGLISVTIGGFFGGLDYISIIIGLTPVALGRIIFGKSVLNYLIPIYGATVLFLSILQAPIKLFPELYQTFYLKTYSFLFAAPKEGALFSLDTALAYRPILACLVIGSILYAYREKYFNLSNLAR